MAMHPSAIKAIILSAIIAHMKANVGGVTGLPADVEEANWQWPGEPKVDREALPYFVRVTLDETEGEAIAAVPDDLAGEPDDQTPGYIKQWIVLIDIFVKRVCVKDNLSFMPLSESLLKSAFTGVGTLQIPVVDIHRAGATLATVGCLKLVGREPRAGRPDKDWLTAGWAVQLEAIEVDSTV